MAQNTRKLLAHGRDADISHEEKAVLQKEIKEQEVLLQGYQKVSTSTSHCPVFSNWMLNDQFGVDRVYVSFEQVLDMYMTDPSS